MEIDFNDIVKQADISAARWIQEAYEQNEANSVVPLVQKITSAGTSVWDFIVHRFYPKKDLSSADERDTLLFSQILVLSLASQQCSIFAKAKNLPVEVTIYERSILRDSYYRAANNWEEISRRDFYSKADFQARADVDISRYLTQFSGRMEKLLQNAFKEIFPQDGFHQNLEKKIKDILLEKARESWERYSQPQMSVERPAP